MEINDKRRSDLGTCDMNRKLIHSFESRRIPHLRVSRDGNEVRKESGELETERERRWKLCSL